MDACANCPTQAPRNLIYTEPEHTLRHTRNVAPPHSHATHLSHIQGGVGPIGGFGDGVWAQAATDPVNGRSMITDDESDEGRYRLTDDAAVRESKYEHEFHKNPDAVPPAWFDHSKNAEPSPSNDSGSYKLGKLGVKL